MILDKAYNRDGFLTFIKEFIPDFKPGLRNVSNDMLKVTDDIQLLGESEELELPVFEISHTSSNNARIALATDGFRVMKNSASYQALVVYKTDDTDNWRLSLLTTTPKITEKGIVGFDFSNPRRFSFFLGPEAKVNTPYQLLIKQGAVEDLDDLKSRFSLEVVNKQFYREISQKFTELVGGTLGKGKSETTYKALLKLPSVKDHSQTSIEFSVRLIGRILFCWFLREKKSKSGKSLMPLELLSRDAIKSLPNYYHEVLEPIFFQVLNKRIQSRNDPFNYEPYSLIPYLNGGLFSPHSDDFFSYNERKQAANNNTVVVPNKWLSEFFEILETYNFTIDENTSFDEELSIDPEMLGRIFENLLAEINPETGESARKSTGSYYTPRVIVDYMVDESLLQYLIEKTHIKEDKLKAIISYDLTDDFKHPLEDKEKEIITNALEELKLLDPACGSGAFPIGALQKMVFILQQIDPDGQLWFKKQIKSTPPEIRRVLEREFKNKNFDYIRKLGIIRENIYGVDIQPIATEISRLRCFLTLVVDQIVIDEADNRGLEPLPNLDFKFVTANTLIGLPEFNKNTQIGLFEDRDGIEELREIRDMFFNASGAERDQLKLEFVQSQNKMFQKLIDGGLRGHADLTTKLTTWDPFSHAVATWFDSEWMFGLKNGFDVVIANPPYVQLQKNGGELADLYKDIRYKTFSRMGDLYCLFYERGLDFLKEHGILTFITSNKWMRANYGKSLRGFLSKYAVPLKLINFGTYQNFGDATTYTNIITLRKGEKDANVEACKINSLYTPDFGIYSFFENNKVKMENLSEDMWIVLNRTEKSIKNKIDSLGTPLKFWDININYGIKTGCNVVFIIDSEKRDSLIKQHKSSEKVIKPVFKGAELHRYYSQPSDNFLIYIPWHFPMHNNASIKGSSVEAEKAFAETYPAIYEYLCENKKVLKNRNKAETGIRYEWYALQRWAADYHADFEKQKIIWKQLAVSRSFYLDEDYYYGIDSTAIITGSDLKYLTGLLNSKLISYAYEHFYATGNMQNDTVVYKVAFLRELPVIKNTIEHNKIISLVDKIIRIKSQERNNKVLAEETALDKLLYEIYGLSEEEIYEVERSIK